MYVRLTVLEVWEMQFYNKDQYTISFKYAVFILHMPWDNIRKGEMVKICKR